MNLSKLLLTFIDIFFAIFLIVLLITAGVLFYSIFISDLPFYFVSEDSTVSAESVGLSKVLFSVVVQLLFIAIIFYLRKAIKGMVENHFFHIDVAKYFNLSGLILTIASVAMILYDFVVDLSNNRFMLGMETDILKSEVFMVIIGLFLMLMSRVIKEGLTLKSENDLTK